MVVVDTTVWIDYLNGAKTPETDWLDVEADRQRLALTDLILCEVLQGVKGEAEAAETLRELMRFEVLSMSGVDVAIESASNYRKLRSQGCTIRKTIDCLIATYCLMNKHSLLHTDRDFDPFERVLGLQVVHP